MLQTDLKPTFVDSDCDIHGMESMEFNACQKQDEIPLPSSQ